MLKVSWSYTVSFISTWVTKTKLRLCLKKAYDILLFSLSFSGLYSTTLFWDQNLPHQAPKETEVSMNICAKELLSNTTEMNKVLWLNFVT